tara:strand:- start:48 stop:278 length:231 start_codon:yes stop_codon:yes gene_type:complete
MSLRIIKTASNTIEKSIGVLDRGVVAVDQLAEMIADQIALAAIAVKRETFTEANTISSDSSLTDEQQIKLLSMLPA